jgi:nitrous oxidase accessory protein NosD
MLQASLDWLAARGGGVLELPAGSFGIGATGLSIAGSNITLRGSGADTTMLLQHAPTQRGLIRVGAASPLRGIKISGLAIVGRGTVLGDYDRREVNNIAIQFVGDTTDVEVHDIAIRAFGVAIASHYAAGGEPTMHRARFERCRLTGLEPATLSAHFGIELNAEDALIENNTVVGFSYGISPSYYSRNNRVANNHIVLSQGAGVGIYMSSATGSTCERNHVEVRLPLSLEGYRADGCIKVGAVLSPHSTAFRVADNNCINGSIKIANASEGVFRNNTITGAVSSGIHLDAYVDAAHPVPVAKNIVVERNVITSPRGSGVYFPLADGVQVLDNEIRSCGSAGVFLQRAKGAIVRNNRIADCTLQAIFVDDATATTVDQNEVSQRTPCRRGRGHCPVGVLVRGSDKSVTVVNNRVGGYDRDVMIETKEP